jgi:hypothetical protein
MGSVRLTEDHKFAAEDTPTTHAGKILERPHG